MKVQINHTLVVSEERLVQMADVLDGKTTKRRAKRDEVKDYVWSHGSDWETALAEDHAALFGSGFDEPEDLIGSDLEDDTIRSKKEAEEVAKKRTNQARADMQRMTPFGSDLEDLI